MRVLQSPPRITDDLARNMAVPVKWHDTTVLAYEQGVRLNVEMPPGSVLTKLSTAALPEALSVSASNTRVDTLSVLMERERHTEC